MYTPEQLEYFKQIGLNEDDLAGWSNGPFGARVSVSDPSARVKNGGWAGVLRTNSNNPGFGFGTEYSTEMYYNGKVRPIPLITPNQDNEWIVNEYINLDPSKRNEWTQEQREKEQQVQNNARVWAISRFNKGLDAYYSPEVDGYLDLSKYQSLQHNNENGEHPGFHKNWIPKLWNSNTGEEFSPEESQKRISDAVRCLQYELKTTDPNNNEKINDINQRLSVFKNMTVAGSDFEKELFGEENLQKANSRWNETGTEQKDNFKVEDKGQYEEYLKQDEDFWRKQAESNNQATK